MDGTTKDKELALGKERLEKTRKNFDTFLTDLLAYVPGLSKNGEEKQLTKGFIKEVKEITSDLKEEISNLTYGALKKVGLLGKQLEFKCKICFDFFDEVMSFFKNGVNYIMVEANRVDFRKILSNFLKASSNIFGSLPGGEPLQEACDALDLFVSAR